MKKEIEIAKRIRDRVEKVGAFLEQQLRDDDDMVLQSAILFDEGEDMKSKSILDQAKESVAKIDAEVRDKRAKRDLAEEVLRVSRLPRDEEPLLLPSGHVKDGKRVMMTVMGAKKAQGIGERTWRDTPEYEQAVLARMELGDAIMRRDNALRVVEKIERQAKDLRALLNCVEAA